MRIKVNFEATVKVPNLPNFITIDGKKKLTIPIQDFSNEELERIGEQWTKELINLAEFKRKKEGEE